MATIPITDASIPQDVTPNTGDRVYLARYNNTDATTTVGQLSAFVIADLAAAGITFTAPVVVPSNATGQQAVSYAQVYQMVTGTAALLTNYNISTTVGGTPASGTIRYNHATQTSATQLFMSTTASDGLDLTNFIAQTGINDTVYIQEETNSANYQKWKFTSTPTFGAGYATFSIELVSSAGTGTTNFANALPVITYGKAAAAPVSTDSLPEGATNLYFTEARVAAIVKTPITVSASRALADSDHDCLLRVTGAYTLTANSGLRADFRCRVQQTSASQVTFANGTATFRNSYGIGANAKTAAQYATVYLEPGPSSTELAIIGDITA